MIKTINTPRRLTIRDIKLCAAMSGTLNRKKIGKHRRGSLLLLGINGSHIESGTDVVVRWAELGQFTNQVRCAIPGVGVRRFQIYRFADHGKLLKVLNSPN